MGQLSQKDKDNVIETHGIACLIRPAKACPCETPVQSTFQEIDMNPKPSRGAYDPCKRCNRTSEDPERTLW
jgi:hypothetical protein